MSFGTTCLKLPNCELCSSLFNIPLCVVVLYMSHLDRLQLIKLIIKKGLVGTSFGPSLLQ